MAEPLILTVSLDPASQAYFDRLRQRYFPPSRNVLDAHVTMFHHLPGEQSLAVQQRISALCSAIPPCPVMVRGLRFLGHGTAFELSMPPVEALRRQLAGDWAGWLTAQDRQPWRPHVTVQNKVATAEAKRVHAELTAGFQAFAGQAIGLHLWRYLGGPWGSVTEVAFGSAAATR